MNNGWIKLHRKLLDDAMATKPNYMWLWINLLLMANHKEQCFIWNNQKEIVKKGQLLTGLKQLSRKTGIAQGTVYRILKYLENEKQIEQQKTTRFTLITIINWGKYQADEKQNEKRIENGLKTDGKRIETNKNEKKEENDNNDNNNKMEIMDEVDLDLKEILDFYNEVFDKGIKSTKGFEKNYRDYWRDIHGVEVIKRAIAAARLDKFWKDKMTLTILFRRKNTNGEDVDYITDLSSRDININQARVIGGTTSLVIN